MHKSIFEAFLKRYSLDGVCETAHWYSDSVAETLTARAHTESKTVILKVVLKKWTGVESCQLALPSSTKLQKMLSPVGEEISVSLNKIRDRVANFTVSDNDCEIVCTVAEYDAFPETLDVDSDSSDIPSEFDVEIKLTSEFVDRFLRAMQAISEAKDFVLMNNKKGGLDAIINYEDTNTNRIRLPVTTLPGKDKIGTPFGFSTEALRAIITTNRIPVMKRVKAAKGDDADVQAPAVDPAPVEDPILKVSSRGIAIITFEDADFKSTYFLFPTRVIE